MILLLIIWTFLTQDPPVGYDPILYHQAVKLAKSTLILDGHIDTPSLLDGKVIHIATEETDGEFDYLKAKRGGLDAPFMSIYIGAGLQSTKGASKKHAEKLIHIMDSVITKYPKHFAHGLSVAQVLNNFNKGIISLPYGMENGSAIEDDLANVEYFFNKGIRYITLTHSKKNLICDSSYDTDKGWGGISPFGKQVILEMNRLGMMVDISHVSDSAFYQAIRLSKTPPIASHSSCRHFTPGFERNVDDDMLKALAKAGGVIQINFGSSFLTEEANGYSAKRTAHMTNFSKETGITKRDDPKYQDALKEFTEKNPYPMATIQDVVHHIDHAVKLVGVDFVGLGSDYDGVGPTIAKELKTSADFPNLIYHLLKKGYSESDIEKICSGNVLRVWKQTERYAKSFQN